MTRAIAVTNLVPFGGGFMAFDVEAQGSEDRLSGGFLPLR